jgi:hypothetical protein
MNKLKEFPPSFIGNATHEVLFVCVSDNSQGESQKALPGTDITVMSLDSFKNRFLV